MAPAEQERKKPAFLTVSSEMLTKEVLANHIASDSMLTGINIDQANGFMTSTFAFVIAQAQEGAQASTSMLPMQMQVQGSGNATAADAREGAPMEDDKESVVSEDAELPVDNEEEMKLVESKNSVKKRRRDE